MKNNIKIIESKSKFDLNFTVPQAQLSDEQLSKLFGGNTDVACQCRRGPLTVCHCEGDQILHSPK